MSRGKKENFFKKKILALASSVVHDNKSDFLSHFLSDFRVSVRVDRGYKDDNHKYFVYFFITGFVVGVWTRVAESVQVIVVPQHDTVTTRQYR